MWPIGASRVSDDNVVLGHRLGRVGIGNCPRDLHIEAILIIACRGWKHLSWNSCSRDFSFCIRSPSVNVSSLGSESIKCAWSYSSCHNKGCKLRVRGITNKLNELSIWQASIPFESVRKDG